MPSQSETSTLGTDVQDGNPLAVKQFKFLATKLTALTTGNNDYKQLTPLAEDLLTAPVPAPQGFVERMFSLCGLLTTGWCNRTCKSLEM